MKVRFADFTYRGQDEPTRNLRLRFDAPPEIGGRFAIEAKEDPGHGRMLVSVSQLGPELLSGPLGSRIVETGRIFMTASLPRKPWLERLTADPSAAAADLLAALDQELLPQGPFTLRGDPAAMVTLLEAVRDLLPLSARQSPYIFPLATDRIGKLQQRIWNNDKARISLLLQGLSAVPPEFRPILDWFDPVGTVPAQPWINGNGGKPSHDRRRMGIKIDGGTQTSGHRRMECTEALLAFWRMAQGKLRRSNAEVQEHLRSLGI